MTSKMEQHLLMEIGEIENENVRLRTLNRKLQTQNYEMQCRQNDTEQTILLLRSICGDYYRTVNKIVYEKARLRTNIHDILFEHQETIPDGVYLQLMNLIKE